MVVVLTNTRKVMEQAAKDYKVCNYIGLHTQQTFTNNKYYFASIKLYQATDGAVVSSIVSSTGCG